MERTAYILAMLGVIADQLTTRLGMAMGRTREANPFTARLISGGLWLPVDLVQLFVSTALLALIIRRVRYPPLRCLVLWPLIGGAIRLAAALWNLHLIL